MLRKTAITLATTAAMALFATGAQAALVLEGPDLYSGAGLGAVNTVLTIQSQGSGSFESGSVGLAPGGAEVLTGDAKSQTSVKSFSALGITDADDVRIIFNAAEPGGDGIVLESLVLNVFNPTGTLLFTTSYAGAPHTFDPTYTGTGSTGFAFLLDDASSSTLQLILDQSGSSSYLVGLSASASMATGGQETFFVASANTVSPIPEPESYAMMLAGLGLMGYMVRRRSKKDLLK